MPEPQAVTTNPSQAASPVTPLLVLPGPQHIPMSHLRLVREKQVCPLFTLKRKSGEALDFGYRDGPWTGRLVPLGAPFP